MSGFEKNKMSGAIPLVLGSAYCRKSTLHLCWKIQRGLLRNCTQKTRWLCACEWLG